MNALALTLFLCPPFLCYSSFYMQTNFIFQVLSVFLQGQHCFRVKWLFKNFICGGNNVLQCEWWEIWGGKGGELKNLYKDILLYIFV